MCQGPRSRGWEIPDQDARGCGLGWLHRARAQCWNVAVHDICGLGEDRNSRHAAARATGHLGRRSSGAEPATRQFLLLLSIVGRRVPPQRPPALECDCRRDHQFWAGLRTHSPEPLPCRARVRIGIGTTSLVSLLSMLFGSFPSFPVFFLIRCHSRQPTTCPARP